MRWFGLYLERGEEEVAEKHRRMLWNILGGLFSWPLPFFWWAELLELYSCVGFLLTNLLAVVYAYMYFVRTQDNETHDTLTARTRSAGRDEAERWRCRRR